MGLPLRVITITSTSNDFVGDVISICVHYLCVLFCKVALDPELCMQFKIYSSTPQVYENISTLMIISTNEFLPNYRIM